MRIVLRVMEFIEVRIELNINAKQRKKIIDFD